MKIFLTKTELLAILNQHCALGNVTDFTITKPQKSNDILFKTEKALTDLLHTSRIYPQSFNSENKIPAIKCLREVTGAGLADSKWAIENWSEWKEFVKSQHRLPNIHFLENDGYDPATLS
jgi:hypothetical protein